MIRPVIWVAFASVAMSAAMTSSCILDDKYTVGGTVTGLVGSGLVLENNAGDSLSVTANGGFTFSSGVANADAYSVTVTTQPSNPAQTCTVHNASGSIDKADIINVIVNCTQAGQLAYVANQSSNDISAFSIDASTGTLTPIDGSPFPSGGTTPVAVTVDPNGQYLYVANNASNVVSVYTIAGGVLTAAGVAIATGAAPMALCIDPADHFLFVANFGGASVSAYTLDNSTGLATEVSGSPFAVGNEPISLKTDPGGNYLYVTNFADNTVSVLAIDPTTGILTAVSGSPFGTGAGAVSIAIDPAGTFAYVANETGASISSYSINSGTGGLVPVSGSPLATGSNPESVVVDPAGRYVYAANVTSDNDVASYSIAPVGGGLSLSSTVGVGAFPLSIVIDQSGLLAYVANENSADVSVFSVDPTTGILSAVGSPVPAGTGPRSIAIY